MEPHTSSQNPIHRALEVAGIPWQVPLETLATRYGIRPHAVYGWNVIEIGTAGPFIEGLLWPLSVQVIPEFSPRMPPGGFSGTVSRSEDARHNLQFTAKQLMSMLGTAEKTDSTNTLGLRWRFDAAAVSLTVWPPELQKYSLHNPSHEREPRLRTACHLEIVTGYRQPIGKVESTWLETFEPIVPLRTAATAASALTRAAAPTEVEFVRTPDKRCSHIFGWAGCDARREALIVFNVQLYVIPMPDVVGFQVARVRPAKGPGGAYLSIQCRTGYECCPIKRITIATSGGADDLNDLGSMLSNAVGRPLTLGQYEYDT